MKGNKLSKMAALPLIAILTATLAITACTPAEVQALNGILQNVDSANGKITIVTNDGKTVEIKIDSDTKIAAGGANATADSLAPGASIDIKVKDGKVAREIEAKQAEVTGKITGVVGANVTVQSSSGKQVTVQTTNQTRIELENSNPGTLADLKVGLFVEAKYNPTNNQALKIEVKQEDGNKGNDDNRSSLNWGIVEVRVTDPPPPGVKSAIVSLSNIEVHKAIAGESDNTNVTDNSSSWIPITTNVTSFDLLGVIGIEQILGSANLSAGKYTQIRMSVANVTGLTTDNVSYTAQVPGDKLKIVGNFTVGDGKTTVLTLDFDGEKSLVRTGNGTFIFKPVVKLLVNNQGKGSVGDRGESESKGSSNSSQGKENSSNNSSDKDNSGKGNSGK